MTHLDTQPAEYNYSTFNEGAGVLLTQGDDHRIYTMNSNQKSKESRLNSHNFVLNTGSSSTKKPRQKSSTKISSSKSRQKANPLALSNVLNHNFTNSNFNSNQQNELFKPMQISSHIKQSAKLRTKPTAQMSKPSADNSLIPSLEIEINNVVGKLQAKQSEASRTQAHPITSLTNPQLQSKQKSYATPSQLTQQQQYTRNQKSLINTEATTDNQISQHSSILQQNKQIQNQLTRVSKKVKP